MLRRNRRDNKSGGLIWVVPPRPPAAPAAPVETPEHDERTATAAALDRTILE
jgi:hypothetical protein